MKSAPLPENESERLAWLHELDILDTIEEQAYDDLTLLAAQICDTPIALVSLVDRERQWFKSHHGLAARETPRELAFCAHAILGDEPFVVEDAGRDERFHDNPLTTGAPHVKFYAGAPLRLRNNIRVGTLCVIDDHARGISDEQRAALTALARQVVSQMELRLKIQALHKLDRAKDEFISMVSHELRTPLTAISGGLGLLHNKAVGALDGQASALVELALRNTGRLLGTVNDILDISKIEAGRLELRLAAVDLAALAAHAVELNEPYCVKCGCTISLLPPTGATPLLINGDEQRLAQVLTNFISNAAKFTNQGDAIEVTVNGAGERIEVSVTDHGPGIPATRQDQLFQRFGRLGENSDAKLPGTGLGLHICKKIIDLHGGEIGCVSLPGQQTRFFFNLPRLP